ncbi:MAG: hypothetical protein HY720_13405, partial [Planctomycetes bacterium]|nr:hypothetical protein [Planctomycetota bacterium]
AKLGKPVGIAWTLVGTLVCALILFAAIQMMKLKGRGLAITASILSFIPLNMCCILTLPFGIWALVVLNNAEVKAAFQGQRGGFPGMGAPGQMPPPPPANF